MMLQAIAWPATGCLHEMLLTVGVVLLSIRWETKTFFEFV